MHLSTKACVTTGTSASKNSLHFTTSPLVSTGFPAKWRQGNKRRTSRSITCYYLNLGSASDWLKQISLAAPQIISTTHIWLVARHQYGISAFGPQTSFHGETSGVDRKGQLLSHATLTSVDDVPLKARIHKKTFCFVIAVYCLTAVFPLSVTDGKLKTLEDVQRVAGLATRVELLSAFVFIMTAGARSWTSTVPAKPSPLFLCVVMALVKEPNGSTLSGRR